MQLVNYWGGWAQNFVKIKKMENYFVIQSLVQLKGTVEKTKNDDSLQLL